LASHTTYKWPVLPGGKRQRMYTPEKTNRPRYLSATPTPDAVESKEAQVTAASAGRPQMMAQPPLLLRFKQRNTPLRRQDDRLLPWCLEAILTLSFPACAT